MNSAYKHLDSKLRIAELSVGQWLTVLAGIGLAVGWGYYLSPFGTSVTLASAIYIAALPAAAALFSSLTEFDVVRLVRSAIAWRRRDDRFIPGPGGSARGYFVHADAAAQNGSVERTEVEFDLATLWEGSRDA
jgi:hypothetical protein